MSEQSFVDVNAGISVDELAKDSNAAHWLLNYQGITLHIHSASPLVNHVLATQLNAQPFDQESSLENSQVNDDQPDAQLSVLEHNGVWQLADHQSGINKSLFSEGDLLYTLTDRLVFHVADKLTSCHCLHAASVEWQGKAMVIPASSGSGKSSFTCWLVAQGFGYLTDELITLDSSANIEGVARPIQIKHHGIEAIMPLLKNDADVYAGEFVSSLPVSALGGHCAQQRKPKLSLFVFPQYRAGAAFSFAQLSSAQAGMALMSNHVNARNLSGHGFKDMMNIMRKTPCYALEYGGFNTLPDDFSDQLKKVLSAI